jgi:hypothetical protein
MISFLTLFLGLTAGPQLVQVSVAGGVAAVEVLVDGTAVGRAEKPPFSINVDFGPELSPHELVARAMDRAGSELARVRQWVNLPRPAAEVEVLLERDEKGKAMTGRLAVESLLGTGATSLSAAFDGRPLSISEEERFELPAYDDTTTHLLTVAAEFPNGVRSRRDLVVGGRSASVVSTELTALPVRVLDGSEPDAASLSTAFRKNGSPMQVIAVERGPAQILIVRSLSADEAMSKLGRGGRTMIDQRRRGTLPVYDPNAMRMQLRVADEDRIRFVWPRGRMVPNTIPPRELFDSSHDFAGSEGGLHWLLTRVYHPARVESHPRFADAVAIAGVQAVTGHGRRAVLLVLGSGPADASRYDPASVRRYLAKLSVPLFVWSLENPKGNAVAEQWGDCEDVSTLPKLRAAFARFSDALEHQRIVWVTGEHRPQDIALAPEARGIEVVR